MTLRTARILVASATFVTVLILSASIALLVAGRDALEVCRGLPRSAARSA